MHRTLAAAALVGLALCMVAVPSQAQTTLVVDAVENSDITADLSRDRDRSLVFRLNEADFPAAAPLDSAFVRLSHAEEPDADIALARSGTVWSVGLSVSTPDLVAGDWTASFYGVRDGGGSLLATREVEITSSDAVPPRLQLVGPASPVLVGPGDSVSLAVSDALLRRVSYTFPGLPHPIQLAFPYAIDTDVLPEGLTRLTVRAEDRAGHASTLSFDVDRDSFVPTVDLVAPEHVYTGAPNVVQAIVRENGPYTVRIDASGAKNETRVLGNSATDVNRTTTFTLVPTERNGTLAVTVDVFDRVGNHVVAAFELPLEKPIVDVQVATLRAEGGGPLFAQNPVRLTATVEQVGGVATLDIPITFHAAGQSASFVVAKVPAGGSKGITWETQLPAGRYEVVASGGLPEWANETALGNENATLAIEVFLGQAVHDGVAYNIRANDQGLPGSAIEDGKTRAYPLTLVNRQDCGPRTDRCGVVYEFEPRDNLTVRWDPLQPLPDPEATSSSTSSAPADDGPDAPFPGLVMVLLVVALAALVQRRAL